MKVKELKKILETANDEALVYIEGERNNSGDATFPDLFKADVNEDEVFLYSEYCDD